MCLEKEGQNSLNCMAGGGISGRARCKLGHSRKSGGSYRRIVCNNCYNM